MYLVSPVWNWLESLLGFIGIAAQTLTIQQELKGASKSLGVVSGVISSEDNWQLNNHITDMFNGL